jgi:hypothetical protein
VNGRRARIIREEVRVLLTAQRTYTPARARLIYRRAKRGYVRGIRR